jgi:hypothetical protein
MYANTFMVAGGEIRDFYSAIDPEYEKIRDTDAVTNGANLFIANALRSWPISDEGKYLGLIQGPEGIETLVMSPTTDKVLRREGRLFTQMTGLGAQQVKPGIDKELVRLKIPEYKAYKRYKEPSVDRRAKALYQEYTEKRINPYLVSLEYTRQKDKPIEQRVLLNKALAKMRTEVKNTLIHTAERQYARNPTDEDLQRELTFLLRMRFDTNSRDTRRRARDAFKSRYGRGPSGKGQRGVEDTQKLIEIAKAIR